MAPRPSQRGLGAKPPTIPSLPSPRGGGAGGEGLKTMATHSDTISAIADREYQYGFETDIEQDLIPAGVTEDAVRLISAKKNEPDWMLEWRLKALRHWQKLEKSQA